MGHIKVDDYPPVTPVLTGDATGKQRRPTGGTRGFFMDEKSRVSDWCHQRVALENPSCMEVEMGKSRKKNIYIERGTILHFSYLG